MNLGTLSLLLLVELVVISELSAQTQRAVGQGMFRPQNIHLSVLKSYIEM